MRCERLVEVHEGWRDLMTVGVLPSIAGQLTVMVVIDLGTVSNGCLEVVSDMHAEVLVLDGDGCIRPDVAAGLDFRAVAPSDDELREMGLLP